MNKEEYTSVNEKGKCFNHFVINNKSDFNKFYIRDTFEFSGIWRGCSEAKYKLYTSLQRYWIDNNLFNTNLKQIDYLRYIVDVSKNWNGALIKKVYKEMFDAIDVPTISYLSILRHYDVPVPLIDFTYDKNVSLFFAAYFANSTSGKNEIDSYFSVYFLSNKSKLYGVNKKSLYKDLLKNFRLYKESAFEKIISGKKPTDKDYASIEETAQAFVLDENEFFDDFVNKRTPLHVLEDLNLIEDGLKYKLFINNNLNIINQKGLFVVNNYSDLPLEDAVRKRIIEFNNDQENQNRILEEERAQFYCFDIHKSLKEYILDWLKTRGYSYDYIFPDYKKLYEITMNGFLKSYPEIAR